MPSVEHVAVWTPDIERLSDFYARYFGALAGAPYRNPAKGFESRFLAFDGGARLELMRSERVSLMHGDRVGGPIRWRMHIPLPPERIYEALASDAGRASFWAEAAEERDGAIRFVFSSGLTCSAPILQREIPRLFALDYQGGVARFELLPDGAGGTDLLLTHEGVDEAEWQEVHAGWLNVLFPLKAWVLHGVDLRNHDSRRSWDQGYADQ
jgi:catechol 2,3-dioxygenase-like lactoylglutathione lyase family enzyme